MLNEEVLNNIDNKFIQITSSLLENLGQDIQLITYSEVDCPNCSRDPITGKTAYYSPADPWPSGDYPEGPKPFTGTFCPYCNGTGSLRTEKIKNIKAIVNWRRPSDWKYTEAGEVKRLTARIKTKIDYWDDFQTAKVIRINDMDFEIKSLTKSGFKTLNNLICEAEIIGPSGSLL